MTGRLRVVESHARRYRHTWRSSVFTGFVNPAFLLAAMGLGLGSLVDANNGAGAFSYLAFLAPGLLAATAMQTAAGESSYPVMAGIKWIKSYEAALATPIGIRDLLGGQQIWSMIRVAQVVAAFALVEVLFGALSVRQAALATIPALMTGVAFSPAIAWFTIRLDNDSGLAGLFRFGIIPLFLFSGTFFPISQLPEQMQPLAVLTPLWHGVEWARDWALGSSPLWPWHWHATALAAFAVTCFWGAYRALVRRMVL